MTGFTVKYLDVIADILRCWFPQMV